jgi:hypothetical protein
LLFTDTCFYVEICWPNMNIFFAHCLQISVVFILTGGHAVYLSTE